LLTPEWCFILILILSLSLSFCVCVCVKHIGWFLVIPSISSSYLFHFPYWPFPLFALLIAYPDYIFLLSIPSLSCTMFLLCFTIKVVYTFIINHLESTSMEFLEVILLLKKLAVVILYIFSRILIFLFYVIEIILCTKFYL
jgi:hypothetical protein